MEPSYYQKGTLILSKRNTHQNGILIKMEYSSKWNTHQNGILIKMQHSYYQKETLIKMEYSSKWLSHDIVIELALALNQLRSCLLRLSLLKWNE